MQSSNAGSERSGQRTIRPDFDGKLSKILIFGNNHHLDGFLRTNNSRTKLGSPSLGKNKEPDVMITTSMLSRGLDFSPDVRHVFIVDEPRNMVDFLHRAGRSTRAGQFGKVVVFGKLKGRGSAKATATKQKVRALRR